MVGSTEDIKNLMQKVPVLEAKNRAYDSDISEVQGKVSMLEAKFCNIEKIIKQLADNLSTLLKKMDMEKSQDSPPVVDSQGPNKRTRAHSKKTEDTAKRDEVKAMVENMQMLADQALDLTQTA